MTPLEVAYCFGNVQVDDKGHWHPAQPVTVPLGNGAVGVTDFSQLVVIDDDRLFNPATGHVFNRTKSEIAKDSYRKYFNRETGILVNAWMRGELDDE